MLRDFKTGKRREAQQETGDVGKRETARIHSPKSKKVVILV